MFAGKAIFSKPITVIKDKNKIETQFHIVLF